MTACDYESVVVGWRFASISTNSGAQYGKPSKSASGGLISISCRSQATSRTSRNQHSLSLSLSRSCIGATRRTWLTAVMNSRCSNACSGVSKLTGSSGTHSPTLGGVECRTTVVRGGEW